MRPSAKTIAILLSAAMPLGLCFAVPLSGLKAAGDRELGGDVFDAYCSDCHSVSPRGINRKGPSLYHALGRRAGTLPGFAYSQGMVKSGIVWNPQTLNAYLANPRALIPDGKMSKGLAKPEDRANVIQYLANPD